MNREWEDFFQVRRLWLLYSQPSLSKAAHEILLRLAFLMKNMNRLLVIKQEGEQDRVKRDMHGETV